MFFRDRVRKKTMDEKEVGSRGSDVPRGHLPCTAQAEIHFRPSFRRPTPPSSRLHPTPKVRARSNP